MESLEGLLKDGKGNTLMVIFPHPDDESFFTAGVLHKAKLSGWKTVVVILTKGEAGKIHINPNGESVKQIRNNELIKATNTLLVDRLVSADFLDGKLRETKDKWFGWVKKKVEKENPSIIITYDHSGISGHPDHIVLSRVVKDVVKTSKILINTHLFWVTVPKNHQKRFVRQDIRSYVTQPTHKISLGVKALRKYQAIKAHKSQKLVPTRKIPIRYFFLRNEWYHKVNLEKEYEFRFVEFEI